MRIFHRCHKGRERQSERYTGCVVCVCVWERQRDRQWEKDKYMDLAIFVQAEGHSYGKVLKSLSSYIKNSEQRTTGRRFDAIYTKDKYVRNFDQSYLENYFRNSIIGGLSWVIVFIRTYLIWRENLHTAKLWKKKKITSIIEMNVI